MSSKKNRARLRATPLSVPKAKGGPTFQCGECGSLGPFRDVVYESTPNCAEEYDAECAECGSLRVCESPREAFNEVQRRLDSCEAVADAARKWVEARAAAVAAREERASFTCVRQQAQLDGLERVNLPMCDPCWKGRPPDHCDDEHVWSTYQPCEECDKSEKAHRAYLAAVRARGIALRRLLHLTKKK